MYPLQEKIIFNFILTHNSNLPVLLDIRVAQFAIGDNVGGLGDRAVALGQLLVSVKHTVGCVNHKLALMS